MKKIHFCLSFLIILCITTCSLSALVFADEHSASGHQVWNGVPPYKNIPPLTATCYEKYVTSNPDKAQSYDREYVSVNCGPFGVCCHYNNTQTRFLSFSLNQNDLFCVPNSFNNTPRSFNTTFNGQTYTVYYYFTNSYSYSSFTLPPGNAKPGDYSYTWDIRGVTVYDKAPETYYKQIAEYFLFGIGDLDYDMPPEEIEDGDLDIHGLLASADDLQYVGDSNASSNGWDQFVQGLISLLPDPISNFANGDNTFKKDLGYVQTTVPGINMIWDSPEVSTIADYNDPNNISYTVWADGHSSAQVELRGFTYNDSCNFSKLQLREGPLYYNPSTTSYYNTNSDFDVVLNYFLSNANFGNGVNDSTLNKTVFNTTFSRIYIQASRTDENGDIHKGAVSYVDFSTGSPVIHEGVTQSIDDIESSDSDDGTTQTVTQDYTVSGDTIIYGDTITNNNYTYNYPSGGLDVGDGDLLSTLLELFKALLDLIKDLFISRLVPYISLGFTGGVM